MVWHGELVSHSRAHCTICREKAKGKEKPGTKKKNKPYYFRLYLLGKLCDEICCSCIMANMLDMPSKGVRCSLLLLLLLLKSTRRKLVFVVLFYFESTFIQYSLWPVFAIFMPTHTHTAPAPAAADEEIPSTTPIGVGICVTYK